MATDKILPQSVVLVFGVHQNVSQVFDLGHCLVRVFGQEMKQKRPLLIDIGRDIG